MFQYFYCRWHVKQLFKHFSGTRKFSLKKSRLFSFLQLQHKRDSCWRLTSLSRVLFLVFLDVIFGSLSLVDREIFYYYWEGKISLNFPFPKCGSNQNFACKTHSRRNPARSKYQYFHIQPRGALLGSLIFFIKTNKRHMDDLTQFH